MSEERELKFAGVDLAALRERLRSLDAERQSVGSQSLEDNWIFDRGAELREGQQLLRLRVDRHGARLTYKGPAQIVDGVKIRREDETPVADESAARRILEGLGYEVVGRYQKYREEWHLGSITICLDHTPIGDFVEIEGQGCATVAKRIGFDPEGAETRNYLQLYRDWLIDNPDGPPEMLFP